MGLPWGQALHEFLGLASPDEGHLQVWRCQTEPFVSLLTHRGEKKSFLQPGILEPYTLEAGLRNGGKGLENGSLEFTVPI